MKIALVVGVFGFVLTAATATTTTADAAPPVAPSRAELVRIQSEIGEHIAENDATFARYAGAAQKLAGLYAKLDEKTANLRKLAAACAKGCSAQEGDALLASTREMEKSEMSFNEQYLQLQSQMQAENRSYTAVSAILRTKHETVKRSIASVR